MAKYRIYPNKSNTLIEDNPQINTGLNEVMELWYGKSGTTRHLIKFDYSDYMLKYDEGVVPHISAATTTFFMYNLPTILEDTDAEAVHASSVDLVVKVVQQDWDEGTGRDFIGLNTISGYSNWYSATTANAWASPGGDFLYSAFTAHVDKTYDNFTGSVVNEVALWETFTGQNNGLAVMYTDAFESLTGASKSILKFFTKNTKTWKLPFIEIEWDNQVTDQRDEIIPGTTKRLYLYTEKNNTLTNAYNISGVTVTIGTGSTVITDILNPMVGIYYVDYSCGSDEETGSTFTDVWSVQYESGSTYVDVSNSGTVASVSSEWDNSSFTTIDRKYSLSLPRIQREYFQGENLYLGVNMYRNYTSTLIVSKNMEYCLNIVDGNNRESIIFWDGVSYTQDRNFINIDTSWLLKGITYELVFRDTIDGSTFYFDETKKFKVI